ncbi:MAG: DUF4384 domain-containing protein [bacterium]
MFLLKLVKTKFHVISSHHPLGRTPSFRISVKIILAEKGDHKRMKTKAAKITHEVLPLLFSFISLILLGVFACASQIQGVNQAGKKKPVWVESGKHPAYSDSLFILGVGLAKLTGDISSSRSLADANALGEITKQIKARVKVKEINITEERVVSGKSLDITSKESSVSVAEIYSDLEVHGFSIAERYIDNKANVAYSLAVLDRRKGASALKEEIETLRSYYDACLAQAHSLVEQHRFLRALWYAKEAGITNGLAEERLSLARFVLPPLHLKEATWMQPFGSPFQSLNKAESILSALVLQKISGDSQTVSLGSSPEKPLSVGVYFLRDEERLPVEGALVRFAFQRGSGSLSGSAFTDKSGTATCSVYKLKVATEPSYEISATVDLSAAFGDLESLPEAWKNLIRSSGKRAVFSLSLETEDVESQAQLLALSLADNLPASSKSPIRLAVSNLTYQDLRVSSPFLRYFQEQISMHLSSVSQFQVIKGSELQQAVRTRSIAVTQKKTPDTPDGLKEFVDADAVLMGKCWEKGDSLLSVIVDIIESSSKAALASSNAFIRKARIPANLPLFPANYQDIQQNMASWSDVSSPNAKLEVKLWVDRLDGGVYEEGEKMQAYVWANKDCYLYLIYRDVTGNELLIFPNSYRPNNRIVGNRVYEIPSKSDRFDFTVVSPFGVEIVKAFASTHPMPKLEGDAVGGGIKRLKLSLNKLAETLRGVQVTDRLDQSGTDPLPSGPVERAEASCVVTTVRK